MGFRPVPEIVNLLDNFSSLKKLANSETMRQLIASTNGEESYRRKALRTVFSQMIRKAADNPELFQSIIDEILSQMQTSAHKKGEREQLFIECQETYPYDMGLLSVLFLNLTELSTGQAVFIGAGIPHAYLEGEIIECMANSDNVVRAGLTPKFKDVERLTEILTYESGTVNLIEADVKAGLNVFSTPATEFEVSSWEPVGSENKVSFVSDGPQIILVHIGAVEITWENGSGKRFMKLRKGQSVFIPAVVKEVTVISGDRSGVYRVCVP
jgi:mannose-6-phosphate isomerase